MVNRTEAAPGGRRRVAVVGLGLIGGSLATALHRQPGRWDVVGTDRQEAVRGRARAEGWAGEVVDDLKDAVEGAELVVLAMPVGEILGTLPRLGQLLAPGTVVTDVGSTKAQIVQRMEELPSTLGAIGGHPMCGRRTSGVEGVDERMFQGCTFVLTPCRRTTPEARTRVEEMVAAVGGRPVILDALRHDRLTAVSSHLPHLLSYALIRTAAGVRDDAVWTLAAGGFRAVAGPAPEQLEVWGDILESNALEVGRAIHALGGQLAELERVLESGDGEALTAWIWEAAAEYEKHFGERP